MPIANPTLERINACLAQLQLGTIQQQHPVAGGCICQSFTVTTDRQQQYFVKTHAQAPASLFQAEAQGLTALAANSELRTPQIIAVDRHYLLLEYIAPGPPQANYWQTLAAGLAQLHRQPQPYFGFSADNFCGESPQPNPETADGYQFFADSRLRYQVLRAVANGLLSTEDQDAVEALIEKLPSLVPRQMPSLIHGDLWSGNIYCDDAGAPVLIDPASHYGWREADIAMTCLFGALPERFYNSYQEILPMEPGWKERMPLYNLYHLLNHLNLFGASYLNQVRATVKHFV